MTVEQNRTNGFIQKSIFFLAGIFLSYNAAVAKTTVKKEGDKWQLLVDNAPFDVKGVTFGIEVKKETIGAVLKDLKFLGVNTIRLWGTNDNTKILLDSCQAYGIKIMMGIWMRHGRPGMEGDDSFNYLNDAKGMDDMHKGALETVNKYKNHPAVLFWGVGNEVTLNLGTDAEKKAYAIFLEKVIVDIKKADADHPVASVSAWTTDVPWWKLYTPSIDIYGINTYGGGANAIPDELKKMELDKPYVITEYGVNGEWEMKEDKNGVKYEPGDKQKYEVIANGYKDWIKSKPSCLGVYVFHYEHGNNFGAVWLLLYYNNLYRPQYWATREAFTGQKPVNNVPSITEFSLPDTSRGSRKWLKVHLKATDVENDKLDISFHYNQRSGSRARRDQINPLEFRGNLNDGYEILLPDENGPIKVYAFVKDSYNNLGIAQTSFKIDNGKNAVPVAQGARTTLPFYVYEDGVKSPYVATAYMGDFKYMKVNTESKDQVHSGSAAIKLTYEKPDGWYGLGFVDPADDWGDKEGGYNVTGAKKFTFWAKSTTDEAKLTIGFGLIGSDKPFYDTEKKSTECWLTPKWEKYSIDLKGSDLRCIRSGLTIYGAGVGENYSIWIDDVKFE